MLRNILRQTKSACIMQKKFWKFISLNWSFRAKYCGKSEKNQPETEYNWFHRLIFIGMPHIANRTIHVEQSNICLLKKSGFSIIFDKNSPPKKFLPSKLWFRTIKMSPMQLSNRRMDHSIVFVKNECQISETQWAMGDVDTVSKKFKNFSFFERTNQKSFSGRKIHCRLDKWVVFSRLVQQHSHFQASCENRTQKYALCPLKTPKIEFFSLITRRKKFRRPKV